MRILFFNNASGLGTAKAGGTSRHIEILRRIIRNNFAESIVVTTPGAYTLYQNEQIKPTKFFVVKAHFYRDVEKGPFDRIISLFVSCIHSIFLTKIPKCKIVYSPSDYFCDVIPSIVYKIKQKDVSFISIIHHLCKDPFNRKGNFLLNTISFLFQRISFILISTFADDVLVYDTSEGDLILQKIKRLGYKNRIHKVANGIDILKINLIPQQNKIYTASFAGGLRTTKGIYDAVEIWKLVCKHDKSLKLVMAGEGDEKTEKEFTEKIKKERLESNIILTGHLFGNDLYKVLKSSTLFMSTSHEEGWGIAVFEALACGLPVVTFDLPAFRVLKDYISSVPLFDHTRFANEIIKIIRQPILSEKSATEFISAYDWESVYQSEINIINSHDKKN